MILPTYRRQFLRRVNNGITGDIVATLNACIPQAVADTAKFSQNFKAPNVYESAFKAWQYVRNHVIYKIDPDNKQVIQMPAAVIARRHLGSDCKSRSLLIAGILYNLGAENVRLRYVSYNNSPVPTHVYTLFDYQGRTVPVDTVIEKFDYEKNYTYKTDYKMDVYTLSGVGSAETLNKLRKLLTKVEPASLCAGLIRKQIARESGAELPATVLNPIVLKNYATRLQNHVNWHEKNNKTGACYMLIKQELTDLQNGNLRGGIAGVGRRRGGIFRQAGRAVKRVALAPVRNAFLGIVNANVFNLAVRMQAGDQGKLKKMWEGFGGKFSALQKAINAGKNKAPLSPRRGVNGVEMDEINGVGKLEAGQIVAIVTAAAPILAAVVAIIGRGKKGKEGEKDKKEAAGIWENLKELAPKVAEGIQSAGEIISVDQDGNATPKPGVEITDKQTGFGISPKILMFGGAALVGVLLLTRKK